MRGVNKRERLLIVISISVLLIGFVQLVTLIYRNHVGATSSIEYVKVQFNEIRNAKLTLVQNEEEIERDSSGVYYVKSGEILEISCETDENYGIYSCSLNEENITIQDSSEFKYSYLVNNEGVFNIEIRKQYKITLDIEGNGTVTKDGEVVDDIFYVFEDEDLELSLESEESSYIDIVSINDEKEYQYDNTQYVFSRKINLKSINNSYTLKVVFKIKQYHISVNTLDGISVYINGKKQNECIVSANSKLKVVFKIDDKNNIFNGIYLNSIMLDDSNIVSNYTYELDKVIKDLKFEVQIKSVIILDKSFEYYFLLTGEEGDFQKYVKQCDSNGDIRLLFNDDNKIFMVAEDGIMKYKNQSGEYIQKGMVEIENNITFEEMYLFGVGFNGEYCLYPHSISIIFDTISPTISDYRITQSSDNGITQIITTITDQGDSGLEFVCFGTKADYDEGLTSDKLQEKYDYTVEENKDNSYTITVNNEELTDNYYIWATDYATNVSETMKVDLNGPTISVSTKSEWTNSDIKVEGTIEDKDSNVEQVFYTKDESVAKSHTIDSKRSEEYKEATLDKSSGTFEFSVSKEEEGASTYYIWGYDEVGNKSEKIVTFTSKIDTTCPEVSVKNVIPETEWGHGIVMIQFDVTDQKDNNYSGIKDVFYATKEDMSDKVELQVGEDGEGRYTIQTKEDEDGNPIEMEGYYYICARDYAGNEATVEKVRVNIDRTAPSAESVEIYAVVNGVETDIESLPYGIFYNEQLIVKVKATDVHTLSDGTVLKGSGLKKVALQFDDSEILSTESKTEEDIEEFVFHVSTELAGKLSIVTYDNVGNCSVPVAISKINSNLNDYICLEETSPSIKLKCEKEEYINNENKKWFSTDKEFSIVCEDKESGIQSVSISINGVQLENDVDGNKIGIDSATKLVKSTSFNVSTAAVGQNDDGQYTVEVTVLDNAGNQKKSSKTIYIDRSNPEIKQFAFEATGEKDQKDELIEKMEYGYFFRETTKVTITASDGAPSSGVKAIQYYMMDYSTNPDGVKSKEKTVKVNENNEITFSISKSFKGQVFARAIDCVENVDDYYSRPYGVVVDNSVNSEQQSRVAIELPETEYKDSSQNPLYGDDVTVGVELENSFTGIRSVDWEVVAGQDKEKNQSGSITVSKAGKLQGDVSGFAIDEMDHNLVTKIGGKLLVSNNSNDISIRFVITDRSGQICEKEVKISIDKTAPTVEVKFDKTNDTGYYSEERTATITVKERNFDSSLVNTMITNNEGDIPKISQWSKKENKENPDETIYLATIVFKADGLYSLNVSLSDMVANQGGLKKGETFTIDQSAPVISYEIETPRNKSKNIGYYQEGVKIRLHITERNFDENKVVVTGTGVNNGKEVKLPKTNFISSNGKNQYLQLNFIEEGEYTVSISCTDEAGNESVQMEEIKFIIDKTAPAITIQGVEESKAYNGKVVPVITCSDKNYKASGTKVSFYKGDGTRLLLDSVKESKEQQETLTYDCFPEEEKYDNVYKMVVECSDLSGNINKQVVNFSINRFGSTYYLSDIVQQRIGNYVNSEFDVVLTEVNINELDTDAIVVRMIYNDNVKDLVKDQDYTVVCSGGGDTWYTYEYHISKEMMKEEGKYSIALYSQDGAGNTNENLDEDKMAEIWFGIDKTAPRIVSLNVEEGTVYNEDRKQVNINIDDNLVLGNTKIYVNDKEIMFTMSNNKYSFDVESSKEAQNIRVVAKDLAGNETVKEIEKFYVTTDLFVRFLNNKTLVLVTVIGGIVGILTVCTVVYFVKKKKTKARA